VIWLGAIAGVLCACFFAAFYSERIAQRAIIVAKDAIARQAPLEESQNAFTLHDGAELQVLDQKDEWLQVRADTRRIGWVRKESVVDPRTAAFKPLQTPIFQAPVQIQ
jgi:SH3-like domain-containing protein